MRGFVVKEGTVVIISHTMQDNFGGSTQRVLHKDLLFEVEDLKIDPVATNNHGGNYTGIGGTTPSTIDVLTVIQNKGVLHPKGQPAPYGFNLKQLGQLWNNYTLLVPFKAVEVL